MKYILLLTCALYWPLAAQAQDSTAIRVSAALSVRSANQYYGWYQRQSWATDKMLGRPGWRLSGSGHSPDGWQYIVFVSNDALSAVSYRIWHGSIGGITYSFATRNPEGQTWRTDEMERVGENEWVERSRNARIKRQYSGMLVMYQVIFEPFDKD